MVVGETQEAAREAAEWLAENAITYSSKTPGGQPPTVTLEDAMERGSFFHDQSTHSNAPSRIMKVCKICWD